MIITSELLALKAEIYAAFESCPYPGDHNLVLMGRKATGEQASVADKLRQTDRTRFSDRDIFWHNASFSMMTLEALVYYLPPFLIASLSPEEMDLTFDAFWYTLFAPPIGWRSAEYYERLRHQLTEPQKAVVRRVFQYVAEHYAHYFSSTQSIHDLELNLP